MNRPQAILVLSVLLFILSVIIFSLLPEDVQPVVIIWSVYGFFIVFFTYIIAKLYKELGDLDD
jgi:Na+/pantothenate symporter